MSKSMLSRMDEWKKDNLSKNITETIPIERQITLSWSHINASRAETSNWKIYEKLLHSIVRKRSEPPSTNHFILTDVNGLAYPGQLLVVLGPSGSGKTTLLNCLTFRCHNTMKVSGVIGVNRKPSNQIQLSSHSGYVQQEDLFIESLSVRENLLFQALLRMDPQLSYEHKLQRVEEIICELSLKKCENSAVGIPGSSECVSSGEKKRLAIASELLNKPPLLFCDEPTTKLDSFNALNLIHVLKSLAKTGRTIIITLHQPSSELFDLFDKICLMTEGRVAFFGTPGEANHFFSKLGSPCPRKFNPADHYLQLVSIIPRREKACRISVTSICDTFESCSLGLKLRKIELVSENMCNKISNRRQYNISWCEQFQVLWWRTCLSLRKNPDVVKSRIFQMLFVSGLISLSFWQQDYNEMWIKNIDGALILILTNQISVTFLGVVFNFFKEIPIFLREHKNGMYRLEVFYFSKLLSDFLIYSVINVIGLSICYVSIGLYPRIMRWLIAVFVIILVPTAAMGIGYTITIISNTINEALSLTALVMVPFILLSGIFVNIRSTPLLLQWLADLSWYKYGYEILLINQWYDLEVKVCKNTTTVCSNNGTMILENLGFKEHDFVFYVGCLSALTIISLGIPIITLYYRASQDE